MPIKAQIPALLAISYDITHDKAWLQTRVTNDQEFAHEGQLFLNAALNQVYYRDRDFIVQDLDVKEVTKMKTLFGQIKTHLQAGNLTTATTVGQLALVLNNILTAIVNTGY